MAVVRIGPSLVRRLGGLLTGVALVAVVSAAVELLDEHVPVPSLLALYLLAVVPVALVWGPGHAAPAAVVSAAVFVALFLSPVHPRIAEAETLVPLVVFLLTAAVVGELAARLRQQAREAARLGQEQAALRRVATLVATGTPAPDVFDAVIREVAQLCRADLARLERYEEDGTVTGVAVWSRVPVRLALGTRIGLEGASIAGQVRETHGPARVDSFAHATGPIAAEAQQLGIRSSVGCPVVVDGRLWGVIAASTKSDRPFPPNTEAQIADFTELVATAVANADSAALLAASRARIVAASDDARRRIERDMHDGAQQRLVALGLELRLTQESVPPELPGVRAGIGRIADELGEVLDELREMSRGIHPAILTEAGLGPALGALARRAAIPVELDIRAHGRFPEPVEVAAYYAASEALTNTAKHADASYVTVLVEERHGCVWLSLEDDGTGGADPDAGSGLLGVRDRVEALGGSFEVTSRDGEGTLVCVALPLRPGRVP